MPKGCWRIIFAAVGWLTLSAQQPKSAAQSQQDQSAAALNTSTTRIVDAINNIVPEDDKGCEDREDKRSSDLCAQWKAADAAHDAANYTWLAVGLSFLGTVFVALTFWDQRQVSRAQLRAYVSIQAGKLEQWSQEDGSRIVEFNFTMKNAGTTPAYKAIHMGNVYIFTPEAAREYFNKPAESRIRVGEPHSAVIHNGQEQPGCVRSYDPIPKTMFDQIAKGRGPIY